MMAVAAGVSAALFALPFAAAGYSFVFFKPDEGRLLTYYLPAWTWAGRAGRFVYKNLYLLGPFATLWAIAGLFVVRAQRIASRECRALLRIAALVCAGVEAAFFTAPLETAYLIPMLPFIAIALAARFPSRRLLSGLVAAQLAYACVNLSLLVPDVAHNASTARVAPRLEEGVVVRDVDDRLHQRRR